MPEIANALKILIILACLAWLGRTLVKRQSGTLHISWAIFCVGMAAVLAREVWGDALGAVEPALRIAGCATCGLFWVVARALFRPGARIGFAQVFVVGMIFFPTIFDQFVIMTGLDTVMASTMLRLDNLQLLFSSTVLVLALWEAVAQGFTPLSTNEQRLRVAYLASAGLCISTCVIVLDHGAAQDLSPELVDAIQAACAALIMVTLTAIILYRERFPLPVGKTSPAPTRANADKSEIELGRRLRRLVSEEQAYLDPELKVADLAHRLNEPEYRVSRAITAGLGIPNFNRFINSYRIEAACAALADPDRERQSILSIALDSGFASIGPFNRAFKDRTGQTPRQYRLHVQSQPQGLAAE